ncbi:hypothetical protein M2156_008396 [Streptomyces sp. SAI-149]|nr:hypothetical protein [Streptomyces sp. SAI-119]MDH6502177.1 hypothetical protein [Streptomyces sp. SAI-149]
MALALSSGRRWASSSTFSRPPRILAHGTRHTAHGTRHTAHGTRHTAHGTRHTANDRDKRQDGLDGVRAASLLGLVVVEFQYAHPVAEFSGDLLQRHGAPATAPGPRQEVSDELAQGTGESRATRERNGHLGAMPDHDAFMGVRSASVHDADVMNACPPLDQPLCDAQLSRLPRLPVQTRHRAHHSGEDRPAATPSRPGSARRAATGIRPANPSAAQHRRAMLQPTQELPRNRHRIRQDRHLLRGSGQSRVIPALGKIRLRTESGTAVLLPVLRAARQPVTP